MSDTPATILIIDDDFATRLLAAEALGADGFVTEEAASGQEALERISSVKPSVVMLDVNMPGLDGHETCRRIREIPGYARLPIVMMTANDDVESVERAFEAGATDFVPKPLNLPMLGRRVRFVLRAAQAVETATEAAAHMVHAQQLARLANWQIDSSGTFRWMSNPYRVFWPEAATDLDAPAHVLDLVHPEDHERIAARMAIRSPHQLDFQIVLPDGSARIVHQTTNLLCTDAGTVMIGAVQDVTETRRAESQITQLAYYDDQLGIPNVQFLDRYLRAAPSAPRFAIVIDLGAAIVDQLPRKTRDPLLRLVAARVLERVRGADTRLRLDQAPTLPEEHCGPVLVARTGVYELCVVSVVSDGTPAPLFARRLAEALSAPFPTPTRDVTLQPRFGVAEHPAPVAEQFRLYGRARAALEETRSEPPRNIAVYSDVLRVRQNQQDARLRELVADLQRNEAGLASELSLEYVVRHDAATRQPIGVRPRPRWTPLAGDPRALEALLSDDAGIRDRVRMWKFTTACREAPKWTAAAPTIRIAVPLSPTQLASHHFEALFQRWLADARLLPSRVDIEVMPGADLTGAARAAATLQALRGAGARIVHAGVSERTELQELLECGADAVLLEPDLVARVSQSVLERICKVVHTLGMRVTADGLQTPGVLGSALAAGVDEIAGAAVDGVVQAATVPLVVQTAALDPPCVLVRKPAMPAAKP